MYYIICGFQIAGYHKWDGATAELEYLKNKHRHTFTIIAKIKVEHDDRDKEINKIQDEMRTYLQNNYGTTDNVCEFGNMSCEMIAREISDVFGAISVEVLEDEINGAGYIKEAI